MGQEGDLEFTNAKINEKDLDGTTDEAVYTQMNEMIDLNTTLIVKENENEKNENIKMNERVNSLSVASVQEYDDDEKDLELEDMYIAKNQPGSVVDVQPNPSVELLKKWRLEQYVEPLIEDGGYEDIDDWKNLTLEDLKRLKFKEGHATKFMRKIQEEFEQNLEEGTKNGEGDLETQMATKGQDEV